MLLEKTSYHDLGSRQKENYNYHKVSSLLAEYGYTTIRLNDDWNGADFIAVHINGNDVYRFQQKGRATFDKKYIGKNLYICFPENENEWYIYDHDKLLNIYVDEKLSGTKSWDDKGNWSYYKTPKWLLEMMTRL